jgi:hypothetical protein
VTKRKSKEKPMIKPQTCTETYFPFEECTNWLEQKHNFKLRGFVGFGKNETNIQNDEKYRDFWHWMLEKLEMYNGMLFVMDEEWWSLNLPPDDWRKQILNVYMDEFGTGEVGKRIIKFRSCW